jgi:type II secretory ATPase GspE/PulE/Tfp pilus assembly ATPase PilB-like protein
MDMDIDPFNFADALLGIMAQRLIRTFCKECKEGYSPDKAEYDDLAETYGNEFWPELNAPFGQLQLFRPKGCTKCSGGYKGRLGIHELLVATDEMKRLIQKKASVETMRGQALKDGMRTLLQDGLAKAVRGLTDAKQVRAVCIK